MAMLTSSLILVLGVLAVAHSKNITEETSIITEEPLNITKEASNVTESNLRLSDFSYANNFFARYLYIKLSEVNEDNILFSPFSISSALSMLFRGTGGDIFENLRFALGLGFVNNATADSAYKYYSDEFFARLNPEAYKMDYVSAIVVDSAFPIFPEYKEKVQDVYDAYVVNGNIAHEGPLIVSNINTYATVKSGGTITSFVNFLDPSTTLFLASGAYFKGAWKTKFDPENTKPHPFYNGGIVSNASDIPMMYAYDEFGYFYDDDGKEDFEAVELFYEHKNLSMIIFLPQEYDGIFEVEGRLTVVNMRKIRKAMVRSKVHVTMPKFKLAMEKSLIPALKKMHLGGLFEPGSDFSRMVAPGSNIMLNDVQHKASIEVDERGSVAKAVTRRMTTSFSDPELDPVFIVDHPFLFTIIDRATGLIFFIGRVIYL